jgi:hypothetical protein
MNEEDTTLSTFLDRWKDWASKSELNFSKVKGTAAFSDHPCTWKASTGKKKVFYSVADLSGVFK